MNYILNVNFAKRPLIKLSTQTFILFVAMSVMSACKKDADPDSGISGPKPAEEITTSITINRGQKYQTIDGFGFFGAQSVWWVSNQANLFSEAWATQVIEDLGITIWRNEYYPPPTPTQGQDANWNKQKPVVEGLARVAARNKVPLKFVFTVWSPPAAIKCALGANDIRQPGVVHSKGTKEGGTLDPNKYNEFGNWLAEGIQLYKESGIDVYALSPQNEPLFKQPFNSCFYKPEWYADMLKASIPVVKAFFPEVKIFGSENMLELEAGKDKQYFYHNYLMKDAAAREQMDIWAVHGYLDGVAPTATSQMAQLWKTLKADYVVPSGKPVWMTETSGYTDSWKGSVAKPGALDLGLAIHAALYYGNASAWVWWQGSDANEINEYNLMQGTRNKGKRYYVSKHYYRFVRPGARMVKVNYKEQEGIFVSAFEHDQMGTFVTVMINSSDKQVKMSIEGNNIPDTFEVYQTTAAEDCVKKGLVNSNAIVLPPSSVITLVNGNVYEQ